ncbi:MAG TPA: hypothetical protein VGG27_14565 [Magnetospirillaceae bacterium]|jgi:hypothetical protein
MLRFSNWRVRFAAACAGVAVVVLAACYLPNNFKAEIRLSKNGDFALAYYGELVWAPLYRDIQNGKYSSEEIPKQVELIRKDLARDTGFKTVESLGQGRFKVEYERQGHLAPSQEVTFVRRNAIIILMKATADGKVTVNSAAIKPSDAKTIADMGLAMKGQFRIVTDGYVKDQNATRVEPYQSIYQLYIWDMNGPFAPSVHFSMQREGAWPVKPPNQ